MDDVSATSEAVTKREPTVPARFTRPAPQARPPQALRPQAPARPAEPRVMDGDSLEKIALIEKAIEDIRPFLKRDGGDCELVDVEGNTIYVKLTGACVGCHMASVTIAGVQERLVAMLRVPLRVVPVG
ncbi:NIF system FeS cluster assembly NifU C-terminal domain-containing protein [Hyphomicrobium sp. 1Nfss2.1]|uniref:NifU family protein n=1 Tax=unclassified Hyphomicrobium TaxID=2619925 RepID=UPI0009300201|nr:NifU family protein [Hyphomicrobium sp. NDB2Meth4]